MLDVRDVFSIACFGLGEIKQSAVIYNHVIHTVVTRDDIGMFGYACAEEAMELVGIPKEGWVIVAKEQFTEEKFAVFVPKESIGLIDMFNIAGRDEIVVFPSPCEMFESLASAMVLGKNIPDLDISFIDFASDNPPAQLNPPLNGANRLFVANRAVADMDLFDHIHRGKNHININKLLGVSI